MPLSAGDKLGPYEILSAIGAGGMGEVYKARDTRLDRSVAIKVLPEHIAKREDLRTRFEREARAVASLNHPHICVLFDIGQQDDANYMVMECLEGETLAARIRRGALPLDLALKFAIQTADALDRAHRNGVMHRDMKPSNLMLTRDGVKVLDFGLARTAHGPNEATLTALTTSGVLLGTPQYMSPEQWEGKQADERSDVFGFGCVVYEMVTGRRAFEGQSGRGPDPPPMSASKALQDLVSVCLAKDPEERWQSMRDVLLQLRSIALVPRENAIPDSGTRRWRWIAAGIGLLSALAGWLAHPSEPVHTYQVSINPPDGAVFLSGDASAVSPDGTLMAFVAKADGKAQLWVRRLDSAKARLLPDTEDASNPFWSPDSRHVGFFTRDKLKRIEVAQGPPQTICDAVSGRGGSWNARGDIVFAAFSTGRALHRVAASGGASTPVTTLDTALSDVFHYWPHFLPDNRHYLYFVRTAKPETTGMRVGALDAPLLREDRLLIPTVSNAAYAGPAQFGWLGEGSGHLLFLRDDTLLAAAFDPAELEVKGDPFPIAEHVGYSRTIALGNFSASSNGILAYGYASGVRSQLVWRDRRGMQLANLGAGSDFSTPSLSPDGKRLAFSRTDPASGNQDIWLGEVDRATASRFTYHPSYDGDPAWSPDGTQIAFTSQASGVFNLYRKDSTGAGEPERLAGSPLLQFDSDWSRDGRFLLFTENGGKTGADLMILPLAGRQKYFPFLQTQFRESQGRFSPDGRWIAYTSNETGTDEVYVQSFGPGQSASGARSKISADGGSRPRWRGDGKELFYLSRDHEIKATSVTPGGTSFQAGPPATLFSTKVPTTSLASSQYNVTLDGERFILLEPLDEIAKPMTLVINWLAGTRR